MMRASSALRTAERLAAWIAPEEWERFAGPMLRIEAAEAAAWSLNRSDQWHEYRVFPRGFGWEIRRRER